MAVSFDMGAGLAAMRNCAWTEVNTTSVLEKSWQDRELNKVVNISGRIEIVGASFRP